MFGDLATKIALKRVGLSSSTFDFSSSEPARVPNKLRKAPPSPRPDIDDDESSSSWTGWMSVKSLPLTMHPWLAPPPPPVEVAAVPRIGDSAPQDRDGKLVFGGGRRVLVVFLRCAGCAFAQKTFLNLRTLANRYSGSIHCIAVSHASQQATKKWIDLLGGAWNVEIVIDEDRALYASWGLGLGSVWYLLNPSTQAQGWKEKGWLGDKVAGAIQKRGLDERPDHDHDGDEVSTVMGNKWQEAGAFAVDGHGTVIWGGKALKADDVMELEEGAKLLLL